MGQRVICLLGVLLAGLYLSGCTTPVNLTRLDEVSPDQAIVVGRFHVRYNGQDETKGCNVVFRQWTFASPTECVLDESGYLYARFPVGKNPIQMIIRGSSYGLLLHRFPSGQLYCAVEGNGVINYIGDITFDWNGMNSLLSG